MKLSEYQRLATLTSIWGPKSDVLAAILGVDRKARSLLTAFERALRDGVPIEDRMDVLQEGIGDLLWYVAEVTTACGLDMDHIGELNLERARDRYADASANPPDFGELLVLDADYPVTERFPRRLVVRLEPGKESRGQRSAQAWLIEAEPNAFPDGKISDGGKILGYEVGSKLTGTLTDNARREDAYRFHDAIHLAFIAVLGWSPTWRGHVLRIKRRSDDETDECEDGRRAIYAEEGLVAVLAQMGRRRNSFLTAASVDGEVLDVVNAIVGAWEVAKLPSWMWRRAILKGFKCLQELAENNGGYLIADLDQRELSFQKEYR